MKGSHHRKTSRNINAQGKITVVTSEPSEDLSPEPVEIEITDSQDLHAFRPPVARAVLDEYLSEAAKRVSGSKDNSQERELAVQREMVRKELRRRFLLKRSQNAPRFRKLGATIVEFRLRP
jgi:hypothetical protein